MYERVHTLFYYYELIYLDGHILDLVITRDMSQLLSGNVKVSDPGLCNNSGKSTKTIRP